MADLRTVAVQVTEDLFSRLKAVLAKNGMKQKDFLIGLIEDAIEKEEAKWKAESEEAEETEMEEDPETAKSEPDEESAEPEAEEPETEALEAETDGEMTEPDEAEADEEPTEPENEEPAEAEPTERMKPNRKPRRTRNNRGRGIRRIDITKQKLKDGNGAEKSALFFSQRREADSRNNSIF